MPHPYSPKGECMDVEQVKTHHCTVVHSRSRVCHHPAKWEENI